LYHFPALAVGYGSEFPRQFAPPLVGRAAPHSPPTPAIDTHSSRSRAGLRPRSLPCPIGQQPLRTRLSAEVGQHAPTTSQHRLHPRQVVGPRDSTCWRIDAQANAAFDMGTFGGVDFPFRSHAHRTTAHCPSSVRRNDEPLAGSPFPLLHPPRTHAAARLPRASGPSAPRVGRECGSLARDR
jgi:hypothetical protein